MSGGELTDYYGGLYKLDEWATKLDKHNPVLAEMMRDLRVLLDRYDYYLSGDIGEERLAEAWAQFRDKWLHGSAMTPEAVFARARESMADFMDTLELGYSPLTKRREGQ